MVASLLAPISGARYRPGPRSASAFSRSLITPAFPPYRGASLFGITVPAQGIVLIPRGEKMPGSARTGTTGQGIGSLSVGVTAGTGRANSGGGNEDLLFTLAIVVAIELFGTAAKAQNYPWCILQQRVILRVNCGFLSLPQCLTTLRGIPGYAGAMHNLRHMRLRRVPARCLERSLSADTFHADADDLHESCRRAGTVTNCAISLLLRLAHSCALFVGALEAGSLGRADLLARISELKEMK